MSRAGRTSGLWGRLWGRKRETRGQQSGYSDAILANFLAYAEGQGGHVAATGALEACAGLWARALASARVTPENARTACVTPDVLALIGRELIRRGESLHEIRVGPRGLRLIPSGQWDVHGPDEPDDWIYQSTAYGASMSGTAWLPAAAVVHCVWGRESSRPEVGIGPMQFAKLTGDLTGNLELRLGEESGGPVGHVLPVPADGGDGTVEKLRGDLAAAKGGTTLAETTAAGWGEGVSAAPRQDWKPSRFGADPPVALASLRTEAGLAVASACGIPPMLFTATGAAPLREAWRQFLHAGVTPIGRTIAAELTAKLGTAVRLDFTELAASDIAGRARAFQSLTGGGMDMDRAAAAAGL
ncbi:MAG: hypothetical protein OXF01_08895 [Gemmatimonadetes bacterium]|nr:hypothetical protein [Gemmatimonadota bacterium]